jgi:hypothetical protein
VVPRLGLERRDAAAYRFSVGGLGNHRFGSKAEVQNIAGSLASVRFFLAPSSATG